MPAYLHLLAFLSSLVAYARGEVLIPLTDVSLGVSNPDGSVNLTALVTSVQNLKIKYARNRKNLGQSQVDSAVPPQRLRNRGVANLTPIPGAWAGQVTVGTPPQSFLIDFDTGSTDFTIPAAVCTIQKCGNRARYTPGASNTCQATGVSVSSSFADGSSSSGFVYRDTVTVGNAPATGQALIAATSLSTSVASLSCDGIMGMAYTSLGSSDSPSVPFTMNQNFGLQLFSILLSSTPGVSELNIGGITKGKSTEVFTYYGVGVTSGMTSKSYWQLKFSAASINGLPAMRNRVDFLIDSGTTLIIAPPASASAFWSQIPGSQTYDSSHWTYPCSNPPAISFSFGRPSVRQKNFSVAAADFNLGYLSGDPSRCVGAVLGIDLGLGTAWILGDAFMKSWHTVFNMQTNSIGFAKAN